MAYLISEEAQDLLQDVKNFCDKEVAEQCKEYDVSGEWPKAIYEKAIEQVVTSGASDGIREIDTAICEQQSKPSEHRIFRARKVEDGELARSKLIAIRKPIRFARARPFLCKVFMLSTVEACAVVVVWTAQLQARLLNDFGRPMPEDHGATAFASVSEVSL